MKIILDTNVINKDYHLQGDRILKLSDAAKRLGYEVMLPEVVLDEICNHFKEELVAAYHDYRNGIRLLQHLKQTAAEDTLGDGFVENAVRDMRKNYIKRLKELKVKTLPYPETKHKDLVQKELELKKPFASSVKGYRDALIWETVKNELVPDRNLLFETQVLFLTTNTKDFANKKKELHPDLVEEFASKGYNDGAIELVSDIDKYFAETIDVEFEKLDDIAQTLIESHKYNRINLDEELNTALYDSLVVGGLLDSTDEENSIGLPLMYENPTVSDVSLEAVESVSVRRMTDETAIIECDVVANAEIEFYVYRADYPLFDEEKMPTILDWEWNDHYYLACDTIQLEATVVLRVSPGFYKMLSRNVRLQDVMV